MKFIAVLFFFSTSVLAIEPMDNYYANDLLDAVDKAKSSPHHYDYSNHYRYKRTTAQSIELNRLDLKELDETVLKTEGNLVDMSDMHGAVIASSNNKDNNSITGNQTISSSINEQVTTDIALPQSSSYNSTYGNFTSSGIRGDINNISTPRP